MMLAQIKMSLQDRLFTLPMPRPALDHVREAIAWIFRAQQADGGVSHSYHASHGWARSYPETTGYIIPTLLNWFHLTQEEEARRRAIEMADWECRIQLDDGAFTGGVVSNANPRPCVFDTGQVLFGLIAAYRISGRDCYIHAARKAADWLIAHVDSCGTWSTFGNMGLDTAHTYNVRVAWAVLEFGRTTGESKYFDAMSSVLQWVLEREENEGWFSLNCLNNNDQPLLHTIAYTAQGLLEAGAITGDSRYLDAAKRTSDALLGQVREDGYMPGRFARKWKPAVKWACLTGNAQMAIVWQRLHSLKGDEIYRTTALKVNNYLKRTQRLTTPVEGFRGGITGSFPMDGDYGNYRVLNWAVKFFIDSLLLEMHPEFQNSTEYLQG